MKEKVKLLKAIADFQQEAPVLLRDTDGYGYKYVTFDHIVAKIKPLLKKHKIGFSQIVEGRGLKTIVFHIDTGDSIEGSADIPDIEMKGMNKYQSFGAGITYYRRYALTSMLGLLSDKDVDAEIYKEAEKNEDNEKPKENKLVTLNIDDGNWEKVMKFIVRNKSKGLRWIISTLETKYSIAQEVEKAIGSHVK